MLECAGLWALAWFLKRNEAKDELWGRICPVLSLEAGWMLMPFIMLRNVGGGTDLKRKGKDSILNM